MVECCISQYVGYVRASEGIGAAILPSATQRNYMRGLHGSERHDENDFDSCFVVSS